MKKSTYFIGNILLMIIMLSSCANLSSNKNITEKETTQKKYGNTSGNLLAEGVLAQDKEWIYYSNSNDGGCIYRKKVGSSAEKKVNDTQSDYLNISGEWIYYRCFYNDNWSIYKMKTDGSCKQEIYTGQINSLSYYNDFLYFNDDYGIKRIEVKGTEKQEIIAGYTENMSVSDGWIYYSDLYGKSFMRIRIDGTNSQVLHKGNIEHPVVEDNWVYYINLDENQFYKMRTNGTEKQIISENLPESVNVLNNHIYYCNGMNIWRMKLDGSEEEIFYKGSKVLIDFSITENALYYEYRTGAKYNEKFQTKLIMTK